MQDLAGRVAVVTGAASGIGLALARRFATEGMRVVLADVEREPLEAAAAGIHADGGEAVAVPTDVSDAAQVERLAEQAVDAFGQVNVVCNNAGVIRPGNAWEQSLDDWAWMLGVNLWGVVHGLRAFVPRMLAQGDDCHVVNTASAGGLVPSRGGGAYAASKFAVVAITEGVAEALEGTRVGVTLLCPGGVATGIFRSERNRPAAFSDTGTIAPEIAGAFAALASPERTDQVAPDVIAGLVVDAIRARELYVLPMQPHFRQAVTARMRRIADALERSPTTGV